MQTISNPSLIGTLEKLRAEKGLEVIPIDVCGDEDPSKLICLVDRFSFSTNDIAVSNPLYYPDKQQTEMEVKNWTFNIIVVKPLGKLADDRVCKSKLEGWTAFDSVVLGLMFLGFLRLVELYYLMPQSSDHNPAS